MKSIIVLAAVTVGVNVSASKTELEALGIVPGDFLRLSVAHMQALRLGLEKLRGALAEPLGGGSLANSADLIARAGVRCGLIGVGGDDPYGRFVRAQCEKTSLQYLCELQAGAVTGYDFFVQGEGLDGMTLITAGANAHLSPEHIDPEVIRGAELLVLDGSALDFGPNSQAALEYALKIAAAASVPYVLAMHSTGVIERHRRFFLNYGPGAQMLAGNLSQMAVLLGLHSGASFASVKAKLLKTEIDAVVTRDVEGAFARFGADTYELAAQQVPCLNSVGAGDNFLGAYLVARYKGLSVPKALAVGNRMAAHVIQHDGARLPLRVNLSELVQKAIQAVE